MYGIDDNRKLPMCEWVYFATTAKDFTAKQTGDFTIDQGVIVRTVYNSTGIRIANLAQIEVGDRVMLTYGGSNRPYRVLLCATVAQSPQPLKSRHQLDFFRVIDEDFSDMLQAAGYVRDPIMKKFTGITVSGVDYLWHLNRTINRPAGNNTIWRWRDVERINPEPR